MSRAKRILREIASLKLPKKGSEVVFKSDNFRYPNRKGKVISIDDPDTDAVEDILIEVEVGKDKFFVGLEELIGYEKFFK